MPADKPPIEQDDLFGNVTLTRDAPRGPVVYLGPLGVGVKAAPTARKAVALSYPNLLAAVRIALRCREGFRDELAAAVAAHDAEQALGRVAAMLGMDDTDTDTRSAQ